MEEEEKETKVVVDDTLMDKITEKVRLAATKDCPNVKHTGRHSYGATGERDKASLKEVYRCICGKETM